MLTRKLPDPCLALFTDRTALRPNVTLAQAVAPAVTGGVNLVVLRESDLPANHRLTVAQFVRDGIRGRAPYLMAEDPKLALEVGADGVHADSIDALRGIREAIGGERVLGVTVLKPEELRVAADLGADYALVPLDWSNSMGALALLSAFTLGAPLPILTGFDPPLEQARACREAGAAGIAVGAGLIGAEGATRWARAYVEAQTAES